MNKEHIIAAVERTGFPLEHRTATAFSSHGWSVVSNKYYVDDNSGEVREIDMIAYKAVLADNVKVYSAIVVSCKKTAENTWVFMTRTANHADPNKNHSPVHYWTNDKALSYSMAQQGALNRLNTSLSRVAPELWGRAPKDIFGFQELCPVHESKPGGIKVVCGLKADNDRALFSSVTTLMKAQAYELKRLPERRKDPVIYLFSLLSVMDGSMVEASYQESPPDVTEAEVQNYIAHYIIKGEEQYCRINFVSISKLEEVINQCDKAHARAVRFVTENIATFYRNVLKDKASTKHLFDDFIRLLRPSVNIFGRLSNAKHDFSKENVELEYDKEKKMLKISVGQEPPDEYVQKLNEQKHVVSKTKEVLKKVYRYDGDFVFVPECPFLF